ncbi:MAG: hypothetical protein ACR2QF_01255 [Geminicoccaceae bacterium]
MIAERRPLSIGSTEIPAAATAFRSKEDGSVAVEYGLIAAFLVVIIVVALVQLRTNLVDLPLPTLNTAFEEALP